MNPFISILILVIQFQVKETNSIYIRLFFINFILILFIKNPMKQNMYLITNQILQSNASNKHYYF